MAGTTDWEHDQDGSKFISFVPVVNYLSNRQCLISEDVAGFDSPADE